MNSMAAALEAEAKLLEEAAARCRRRAADVRFLLVDIVAEQTK